MTTCGLPVVGAIPVVGPLLSSPLVTVAWAIGGFKLFAGFSKTTYTDALLPKLALCALWCVVPARHTPRAARPHCNLRAHSRRRGATRRPVLFAVSATFREQFKRAL